MDDLEDDEEQHLSTLHELEATQEEISSYQGLLKDLPEIYERKFNERLKPILDRNQHLIDEREHLLQQLRQALPSAPGEVPMLPSAPPPPPQEPVPPSGPSQPSGARRWWLAGVSVLGVALGLNLNQQLAPKSRTSPTAEHTEQRRQDKPSLAMADNLRNNVVDQALAEWRFFDRPTMQNRRMVKTGRTEADPAQWPRVLTYWREGTGKASLRDRADVTSSDHPWSAAFISYVMKQAGAAEKFPAAVSHSGLIKEAIYNRQVAANNASIVGFRVTEHAPRVGDLLCAARGWAAGQVTYENAGGFVFFPSRCELVIRTDPGQISTIGGDLMDSVTLHQIKAVHGKVAPEEAKDYLVVLQTKLN